MKKCPYCNCDIEEFRKEMKCINTLFTDTALSYLKLVKYNKNNKKEVDIKFENCSYIEFDKK